MKFFDEIIIKNIYRLMFQYKQNEFSKDEELYDSVYQLTLKNIINMHTKTSTLPEMCKQNIYSYLQDLSEHKKDIATNGLINEIKIKINNQIDDCSITFFHLEQEKRIRKRFRYSEVNEELMASSICFDLNVVVAQNNELVNDDVFEDVFLPEFTNNMFYYMSMNALLKEDTSLFKDDVFKERTKMVLNEYYKKNRSRTIKKLNKQILTDIDKKSV